MVNYEESDIIELNELKGKTFLKKLSRVSFISLNRAILNKYLNSANGVSFALSHIKSSYISLVCSGGWTERKFVDITYLIAKRGGLYNLSSYTSFSDKYHARELSEDILEERGKYVYRKPKKSGNSVSLMNLI